MTPSKNPWTGRRAAYWAIVVAVLLAAGCTSDPAPATADDEQTETAALPESGDATPPTASEGSGEGAAALPDAEETLAPNAVVERVVDGDTIIADVSGARERIRLLGIDTPESVAENRPDQCYGAEASDELERLLPEGTDVTLIRDVEARDQYDRLLAYVVRSDDQLFVNLHMIEAGYADSLIYPPNDYYADVLETAAVTAARNDVGLWGVCGGPDVPLQ